MVPVGPHRAPSALGEYRIAGIRTNVPFHQRLAAHPGFVSGRYDTSFIDEHQQELTRRHAGEADETTLAVALAVATATAETRSAVEAKPGGATLAPWVASHRAGFLRKR